MQLKVLIALVFATLAVAAPAEAIARSDDIDKYHHHHADKYKMWNYYRVQPCSDGLSRVPVFRFLICYYILSYDRFCSHVVTNYISMSICSCALFEHL